MNLTEWLEAKDMKPTAFAALIGVQPSTITRLLNGQRKAPRLPIMAKIIEATDGAVSMDDFIKSDEREATQ